MPPCFLIGGDDLALYVPHRVALRDHAKTGPRCAVEGAVAAASRTRPLGADAFPGLRRAKQPEADRVGPTASQKLQNKKAATVAKPVGLWRPGLAQVGGPLAEAHHRHQHSMERENRFKSSRPEFNVPIDVNAALLRRRPLAGNPDTILAGGLRQRCPDPGDKPLLPGGIFG